MPPLLFRKRFRSYPTFLHGCQLAGGRRTAKGSVTSSSRVRKRNSAGGRPPARPRFAPLAGGLEQPAAEEHPLQVRRGDVVSERGGIDLAELRDRERLRRECEADVRVRQLRAEPLAARQRDRAVVERHARELVDGVPARVWRDDRVERTGEEADVCRRELPLARVALRIAPRLELLEVREAADVDLRRQVAANRCFERLPRAEIAAGERPRSAVRCLRALPEEHLEAAVPNPQHDGERDVRARLGHQF